MRQREIEEAAQVSSARPAVVGTRQEVRGEGQQEGLWGTGSAQGQQHHHPASTGPGTYIADDREVCEAR